jgi:ArsR family transcriptional regulator
MVRTAPQQDLISLMESLADATRLRLLRLLERNELGVAELCHVLQLPQSTVSRHLKVLLDEGWLRNRTQGTANLYRMSLKEEDAAARRLWVLAKTEMSSWSVARQDASRLERLLKTRRGSVEAFFKGAAGHWDRLRDGLYGSGLSEAILPALLPSEWVVADLGCGTGKTAALLARHVRRVLGVDQSQPMLAAAAKRCEDFSNVELRKGSLEAVPIEDVSCDAAVLGLVLSYVPDPVRVLAEAGRILKVGGRLVVTDLLRHDREDFRLEMGQEHLGWEPEEMQQMLEDAGFQGVSARSLPPEPEAKGPALLLASAARASAPARMNPQEQTKELR